MSFQEQWIGFLTISRKEVTRVLRIWPQTLVPPVITLTLYFVIFGALIGSRIGEMGGFDYMAFIVPGLIMMAVITNSYQNTSSSFFGSKFQHNIEEMLVSPLSNITIILGFLMGGLARSLIVGVLVTLVSMFFSDLSFHNIFIVVSVIILTSLLFSLAGLINGIFAKNFDDVMIFSVFVLTPLTYLGGVFYSIDLLPGIWQSISLANPILYMVSAFRYGFLGTSEIPLWISFSMIIGFIVLFFLMAMYFISKGKRMRN